MVDNSIYMQDEGEPWDDDDDDNDEEFILGSSTSRHKRTSGHSSGKKIQHLNPSLRSSVLLLGLYRPEEWNTMAGSGRGELMLLQKNDRMIPHVCGVESSQSRREVHILDSNTNKRIREEYDESTTATDANIALCGTTINLHVLTRNKELKNAQDDVTLLSAHTA